MRPGIMRIKNSNVVYDRQRHEKELVRWQMRSQFKEDPFTIPLSIALLFRMPIPKSASKSMQKQMIHGVVRYMKKPDVDNCLKFYLDCMNGLVYVDDSQIDDIRGTKIYSSVPGTVIRIYADSNNFRPDLRQDGSDIRDIGRGDLFGDCPQQERSSATRRKEDRIVPIRDGRSDS